MVERAITLQVNTPSQTLTAHAMTPEETQLLIDALSCRICVVETGSHTHRALDVAAMGKEAAKSLGFNTRPLDDYQRQLVADMEALRKRLRGW